MLSNSRCEPSLPSKLLPGFLPETSLSDERNCRASRHRGVSAEFCGFTSLINLNAFASVRRQRNMGRDESLVDGASRPFIPDHEFNNYQDRPENGVVKNRSCDTKILTEVFFLKKRYKNI